MIVGGGVRRLAQAIEDDRKYLDPMVLARISGLELRARLLVQGFISGMHRSPAHGFSVEFAEHRKYTQGDDLRFMDWKVYGRTDKHYIKRHEQESNLQLLFAVDTSESMSYQSAGSPWSKREYALTIVAAMAYLALQQADSVALTTFDTHIHRTSKPSNNPAKWRTITRELLAARPRGPTAFRAVLDELAEASHQRQLIVLVSDFLGPVDEITAGLKHLRHRRHEPVVMHVLDSAELEFPFDRAMQLVGLEGLSPIVVEPRVMRRHYLEELERYLKSLRRCCHEQQTDYALFNTRESLAGVLSAYLTARSARARRWR